MSTPQPEEKKKKGWLLPVLLILVALIAVGGTAGGMYFFMIKGKTDAGANTEEHAAAAAPAEPAHGGGHGAPAAPANAPMFVNISPFTVNVQSERRQPRLLYVGLSFQVGDKQTMDFLTQNMPQLRSRLLVLMASQQAETLMTPAGKDALNAQIIGLFQTPLAVPQPPLNVVNILYTDFIVQ
ncbi:MAG: flagellar basal body-associated FliL family protein [Pseudomonas sp.]